MRSVIRMLTPDYLEHCADAVILLYQRLDEAIARDIARRLMKMGEVTDTARWQAEQLQHAGRLYDEVIAEVARYSGMTQEAVRKAFEDAGVKSMDAEIEQYLQAGINVPPIRQNERAWNILQAALKKTGGELLNLTMTTALETQQRFISACTLAEMQVTGGFLSYQEAVRRAIRDAAGEGTSVLYPSGHVDKLDVAVRRAVVTGVNQTCGKITESLADEFQCDLMEITAHAGARPSHAVWQGQIVSRSGRRGYLSLSDIGYGTGAGFQGWNCRHSWNPFFEGISKRSYTKEDIEALNAKDVPYNGGMYTEYEISQMQRRMEREIRATRRELAGLDEAAKFSAGKQKADLQSDFAQSSVKLKRQEAKLRDFTRQTDRRVDTSRVQVMGFGRSVSQKAVSNAQQHYRQWLHDIGALDGTPKTLAGYYNLKYNNSELYRLLTVYSKDVQTGWITPLVTFKNYKQTYNSIQSEIVGKQTSNGILITGQSRHFMQRVVGTMSDPAHSGQKRSGVEITDIQEAIFGHLPEKNILQTPNGPSIKFIGERCAVSLNPDTGLLIQVNPKRRLL